MDRNAIKLTCRSWCLLSGTSHRSCSNTICRPHRTRLSTSATSWRAKQICWTTSSVDTADLSIWSTVRCPLSKGSRTAKKPPLKMNLMGLKNRQFRIGIKVLRNWRRKLCSLSIKRHDQWTPLTLSLIERQSKRIITHKVKATSTIIWCLGHRVSSILRMSKTLRRLMISGFWVNPWCMWEK